MAKKKARKTPSEGAKKRRRRSPEEIIADLQAEIKRVKDKAEAKKLKQSEAVRLSLSAIRAMDKGMEAAADEGNSHLRHTLAEARKTLGVQLDKMGMKLPKANFPKGPKPKMD